MRGATARRHTPSPANPDIDSNLNKPNAPIPTHGNLTWVSTSGMDAYDTPSGDLETGDYAQESDSSYISNVPALVETGAASSGVNGKRGQHSEQGGHSTSPQRGKWANSCRDLSH
jgi:hypothetical protein